METTTIYPESTTNMETTTIYPESTTVYSESTTIYQESHTIYPESHTIYPESYNFTPEFKRWFDEEMYPLLGPFIVLTIMVVLFNGFTLYLFFLERKNIKIPEKYVISMTCSDFITGMANIPVGCLSFYVPGLRDHDICFILKAFLYTKFTIAVITLLITTIDRYHSTVFPHHYRTKVTPKIANSMYFIWNFFTAIKDRKFLSVIILSAWFTGLVVGLSAYAANVETRGRIWSCSKNMYYVVFLTLIYVPLCLLGIIIMYVLLHRKLNSTVFKTQSNVWKQIIQLIWKKQNLNVSSDTNMRELRLTLLLIVTATVALMSFMPTAITYLIFVIMEEKHAPQVVLVIFLLSPLIHAIFHPLLYALNLKKIRRRAVIIFNKICCKPEIHDEKQVTQSSSTIFNSGSVIKFSYHKPGSTKILV